MFKYLVLITCFATPVWAKRAILDLHVQEPLKVYQKADERSKLISQLQRGDVVPISYRRYGRFKKVLITFKGKRRSGYIVAKSMQRSYVEERGRKKRLSSRIYQGNQGAGAAFAFSVHQQPARVVDGDDDIEYDFGELKGSASFLQFFYDKPMAPRWDLRAYITFRETNFKGTGTYEGTVSNFDVVVTQQFVGAGAVLKKYSEANSIFWYGFGGELGYGTGAEITFNEIEVIGDGSLESFVIVTSLHVGWDFHIAQSIFFIPELKAETVLNSDPFIYGAQVIANIGYRF